MKLPRNQTLSVSFNTPERLPISWGFLLAPLIAVCLPKFLVDIIGLRAAASPVNAGTWTGSRIFSKPASPHNTRVKLLEIGAPLVEKARQASRTHGAKLTATIHQLIVRALSKALPNSDITNFVSGTAVDMRGSIGIPAYTWGLFASGYYQAHPRVFQTEPVFSDEMWATASSMTKKLAQCQIVLQDQAIGLLRYAPSIRGWILGKIGRAWDCSYEVSNLLGFDGSGDGAGCKISKMMFIQPGNALSAPLIFNIVSVQGASLVCAVGWQPGALCVAVEEEEDFVCTSLRGDFEAL